MLIDKDQNPCWRPATLVEVSDERRRVLFCADRRARALLRSRLLNERIRSARPTAFKYKPAHRWFYVPEMRVDEAILIKDTNSAADKARFTAHLAFEDATAPPDVPPRKSINLRTPEAPRLLSRERAWGGPALRQSRR